MNQDIKTTPPHTAGPVRYRGALRDFLGAYPFTGLSLFAYLALFPSFVFHNHTLQPLGLCLVGMVVGTEVYFKRGWSPFRFGWVEALLALVVAAYGFATFFNNAPVVLFEAVQRLLTVAGLFLLYLFLGAAFRDETMLVSRTRSAAFMRHIFWILAGAALIQSGIGIYQILAQDAYRIGAHIGNPNFYAAFIGSIFCFLLPLATSRTSPLANRKVRFLFILALMVVPLLVIMSRSRGGAAALGLAVVIYLWFMKGFLKTVLSLAILVLLLIHVPNPLYERMVNVTPSLDQFSRLFIWEVESRNILDHPLGLGPAMGKYHFATKAAELKPLSELVFKRRRDPAHNVLLESGLDGGVLALAALFLVMLITAVLGLRYCRKGGEEPMGFSALLGLAMLGAHAQVEPLDHSPFIGTLAALWLALFLGCRLRDDSAIPPARGRWKTLSSGACLLLFLAVTFTGLAWSLSGQLRWATRLEAGQGELSEQQERYLAWAQTFCPWNPLVPYTRFVAAFNRFRAGEKLEDIAESRKQILRALELHPLSPDYYRDLGRLYADAAKKIPESGPDLDQAVSTAFATASRLDPLDIIGRYHSLLRIHFPDQEEAFLARTSLFLEIFPPFAKLLYNRAICLERLGRTQAALQEYKLAKHAYLSNVARFKGIPEDSLIMSYCRFNTTGFRLDNVEKRIDQLTRQLSGRPGKPGDGQGY